MWIDVCEKTSHIMYLIAVIDNLLLIRGFSPGTPCFLPQGKLTGWVRHLGLEADH